MMKRLGLVLLLLLLAVLPVAAQTVYGDRFAFNAAGTINQGTGSPEFVVAGAYGDLFVRTDSPGGLYYKTTASGSTGWKLLADTGGFIPYTGAASNVDLGAHSLTTSSGLVLSSGVPSPTTATLYNSSGQLTFAGSAVVTSSGSTAGRLLSWDSAYVAHDALANTTTGWLHNVGGTFVWSTPSYSDVGADVAGAAAAVTPTTLGLVIGTNTQAHGAKLDAIQALASAAGWLHNDGSGGFAYSTPTYSQVGADVAGAAAAITLSGLGGVPTTRTINGYALSANISLGWSDVAADQGGAAATVQGNLNAHATYVTGVHGITNTGPYTVTIAGNTSLSGTNTGDQTLSGLGGVPTSRTVNGHALSGDVTVSKSDVGLGSVENTALSTWVGTTNITTLGTISTGTVPWANVSKTSSSLADLATRAVANLSDGSNVALLNAANTFTANQGISSVSPFFLITRTDSTTPYGGINFRGNDSVLKWQVGTNAVVGAGFEVNDGTTNALYIAPTTRAATFAGTINGLTLASGVVTGGSIDTTGDFRTKKNAVSTGAIQLTSGSGSVMLPYILGVSENAGSYGLYTEATYSTSQSAQTGFAVGAFYYNAYKNGGGALTSGYLFNVANAASGKFSIDYAGNVSLASVTAGAWNAGSVTSSGQIYSGGSGVDARIRAGNTRTTGTNYGFMSEVYGSGPTTNYAYYAYAAGATTNYAFYGDGGLFYNAGAATFAAGVSATNLAVGGSASALTGDITTARGSQSGVVFFGTDAGSYIYRNGTNHYYQTTGDVIFNHGLSATTGSFSSNVGVLGQMKLRLTADAALDQRGIEIQPSAYDGTQYIRGYGNSGGGGVIIQGYNTGTNSVTAAVFVNPYNSTTGLPGVEITGNTTIGGTLGVGNTRVNDAVYFGSGNRFIDSIGNTGIRVYDGTNYAISFTGGNTVIAGNTTIGGTLDIAGNTTPHATATYNLGASTTQWLNLYALELKAAKISVQDVIVSSGGNLVVSPGTVLTTAAASGDTTIYVKDNNLTSGMFVMLRKVGQFEVVKVTSSAGGSGPYSYTVTRNQDGSGANDWAVGDGLVSTGATSGDGFAEIYSSTSAMAGFTGPATAYMMRNGTAWNNVVAGAVVGNLNGSYGYATNLYGLCSGDPSYANICTDQTNGVRFRNGTTTYAKFTTTGLQVVPNTSDIATGTGGLQFTPSLTTNAYVGSFGLSGVETSGIRRIFVLNTTSSTGVGSTITVTASNSLNAANPASIFLSGADTGTPYVQFNGELQFQPVGTAPHTQIKQDTNGDFRPIYDGERSVGLAAYRFASVYAVSLYGTLGTSAQTSITSLGTLTGLAVSGGNATFDGATYFDTNGDLRPVTHHTRNVGVPGATFSNMYAQAFNVGDVHMANGWSLTEADKVGIAQDGIAVLDADDNLVAFIGIGALYTPGAKLLDLNDLKWVKTTAAQRRQMETGTVRDVDGKLIKTAAKNLPNKATAKANNDAVKK